MILFWFFLLASNYWGGGRPTLPPPFGTSLIKTITKINNAELNYKT